MTSLVVAGWIWGGLGCAVWIAASIASLRRLFRLRRLLHVGAPAPDPWPRLSVVIAACNEAATLESAVATILAEDYPDLEILLVDDRSTDGTGALIEAVAARDPRVRAVHVTDLPAGWLGKVHALDAGTRASTGSWVLFTDADVHFAPGALRAAIALVVAEQRDHLVVLPQMESGTILEESVVDAFGDRFLRKTRAADIGRPGSDAYAGIGAFNLVRRAALDRSDGFAWLRMEVLDDVGLGLVLRRAGARGSFVLGDGAVGLRWYSSMSDMAQGFEKNLFGFVAHYRWDRLAGFVLGTIAYVLAPAVALATGPAPLRLLGVAALLALVVTSVVAARRTGRRLLPMLLVPIGQLVVAYLVTRSAVTCLRRRGIVWRGTRYPLAALRSEQRVRL
jgi:glycosyltransferase involved in cell wall biosynthesis